MTEQRIPSELGRYQLLERIGEGGMGVVYLAEDAGGQRVAVKVLRSTVAEEPNARQRLAREVATMRRVRSPFVAGVIDADIAGDRPYIVTRYVPGRTLDEVVSKDGPLAGATLGRLASGLAEALAAIHDAGVVHRDLKPSNVMMLEGSPVVIDFGIAQGPDATRLTVTGMFMGTPGYLAPEVIEGRPSSEASDVHAWGATVAYAATARPPFGSGGYEGVFYRIINGHTDLGGAPLPLLPLLGEALSRDPARRPTAAALCARTAALDDAALVPGPATATVPGRVLPGMPAVTADQAASPGFAAGPGAGLAAGPGGTAVARPATRPFWSAGPGGGGVPLDGLAADSLAALLPPVRYTADGSLDGAGADGHHGPAAAGAARPGGLGPVARARWEHALVFASMLLAAGLSVIFPVAGTIASLVMIAELRALGNTQRRAVMMRAARGERRGDAARTVASFPVFLIRAVVAMIMLAPFALAAAAVAAGITVTIAPHDWPYRALAFAAGAAVASYGIGPGSATARHQLGRVYGAIGGTATMQMVGLVGASALAIAALTAAISWPSFYWPLHAGRWLLDFGPVHLGRLRHLSQLGHFGLAHRARVLGHALSSRLGLGPGPR